MAQPPSYHVYDLDANGHEASRASTDTLCNIREEIARADNPVTDVIILAAVRNSTADNMFSEMENQRPAGLNVCYTMVKWPSFAGHSNGNGIVIEPTSGDDNAVAIRTRSHHNNINNYSAQQRIKRHMKKNASDDTTDTDIEGDDAESRFERLFRSLERSCAGAEELVCALKLKCVSYMMDVQRLVDYGKIPNTCLSDDLKASILALCRSICGDDHTVLFDELDLINYAVSRAIGDELARISAKLSRLSTDSTATATTTNSNAKVGTQRNWLMLCYLIGTVVHRAFEKRAWYIGRNWVHPFIADLMRHARPNVRFHVVGTGPGAQLILSALTVSANIFSRKLHSALLTEGTMGIPSPNFPRLKCVPTCVAGPLLATVTPAPQITAIRGYDTLDDAKSLGRRGLKGAFKKHTKKIDIQATNTNNNSKVPLRILAGHHYDLLVDTHGIDHTGGASSNPTVVALFWKVALIKIANVNYLVKDQNNNNINNNSNLSHHSSMNINNGSSFSNHRSHSFRRRFKWGLL